jgi:hypothetical protein
VLWWFAEDEAELSRSLEELAAELEEKLGVWQEHGRAICRAFLGVAAVR